MMKTLQLVVLKRRSLDWKNITIEDFFNQPDNRFYNPDFKIEFSEKIDMWNRTHKINYFKYRGMIKEIAEENLNDLKNVVVCDNMDDVKKLNGNFMIMFIDDDDWIHPNISSEIIRLPMGDYHWEFWNVQPDQINKVKQFDVKTKWNDVLRCYTNNHVISSDTLKRLDYTHMVERHLWLNRNVKTQLYPETLAAVVYHGANITSLWDKQEIEYVEGFNYSVPEWMSPYFEKLKAVYSQLSKFYKPS